MHARLDHQDHARAARLGGRLIVALALLFLSIPPAASRAAAAAPDLDAMIGQMLLVGFRSAEPGDDAPVWRDIARVGVGGVILFDRDVLLKGPEGKDRNILGPAQLDRLTRSLQARAAVPLFIAVDQEGGRVSRLSPARGFPAFPSAAALGRGDPEATRRSAGRLGRTLREHGINLDFAPVADLDVNPDNPVIGRLERSFSADPAQAARHCLAFAAGLRDAGVLSCAKHFPGHGSSTQDSHLGFTDVGRTWSERELVPFRALAEAGGCDMVMTGHLFNDRLDPALPATLSRAVVTDLLRQRLGYAGVVVSDDLQMRAVTDHYPLAQAVRLAVDAGVDILLFGNNLAYDPDIAPKAAAILRRLVDEGAIPRQRIERSYDRIMALKARLPRHETTGRTP